MTWIVHLLAATALSVIAVVLAVLSGNGKAHKSGLLSPSNILFVGVIAASVTLFIPLYARMFETTDCGVFEAVLMSLHNMMRLFIVDGDFGIVYENLPELPLWVEQGYLVLGATLIVAAPLLTFGFVLSFFKNLSAYRRFLMHYRADVFVFSELNERSLTLAESLHAEQPKGRLLVFADVFEREDEQSYEQISRAERLGAVCFKKDIVSVNFSFHSKKSELHFFAIGDDQSENLNQSLGLIETKRYSANANLYVFSTQVEAEVLLAHAYNAATDNSIRVRRVNEVRSLIYRTLYDSGKTAIFDTAYAADGLKHINAVVVGMGEHGTEMVKALSWLCQMDGYRLDVHAFDIDPLAQERFATTCPELMDEGHNGVFDVDGEAKYHIAVHAATDVETAVFDAAIAALPPSTYVFVALGDDERNIATAIKLRTLLARKGCMPAIHAVVYNPAKKAALDNITNYRGQAYAIDFIGDTKTSYSSDVILDMEVENAALKRHLRWGDETAFWQYDYNYKSSMAAAIHAKMKRACGIAGVDKSPADRTEEERWAIRKLEHCRWNAYMRSEGYVYSGSTDKSTRNDLAKLHHCLVPFADLPIAEQEKDDD